MQKSSQAIRAEINALPIDTRVTHARHKAGFDILNSLEETAIGQLCVHRSESDIKSPGNALTVFVECEDGKKLAAIKAVIETIEQTDAYKDAQARLVPLLDELAEAEEHEREQEAERAKARVALQQAEDAAREKALAKIENDSAVKAARQKLEAYNL